MWSKYPEIHEELELIEDLIIKSVHSRNQLLTEISKELIGAGGKRLRPALVVLCAKFGKYDRRKAISAAGALEVLHMATLVHDDIIDCAKLRRGRATVSEKFGMDVAVYTGDFLYIKAVLMLSKVLPAEKLEMVAKDIKTICEGEVDQYEDKYNADTSVASYLKRVSRKTAALFHSSCALGAYISGCSPLLVRKLSKIGFYYGMAFQIKDDIDDYISDQSKSGKPVGKDIAEGFITLPAIYAMKRCRVVKDNLRTLMQKEGSATIEEITESIRLIKENGGIEDARTMMQRYIDRGLKLVQTLPDNGCTYIFKDLYHGLNQ